MKAAAFSVIRVVVDLGDKVEVRGFVFKVRNAQIGRSILLIIRRAPNEA
jgi:hypothetical protein